MQIWFWVRSIRMRKLERTPFGEEPIAALRRTPRGAGKRVLSTPTLVYVFIAGAMISFGMNGLVGWGPTFITRELGLSSGEAARLLGVSGTRRRHGGTLAGGLIADWLAQAESARGGCSTVALGLLIGGPLAVWLMTMRDPGIVHAAASASRSSSCPGTTARSPR